MKGNLLKVPPGSSGAAFRTKSNRSGADRSFGTNHDIIDENQDVRGYDQDIHPPAQTSSGRKAAKDLEER